MAQSAEAPAFSPELVLPFQGYRRLEMDRPLHDLAASLAHFYEAEKFRNTNEVLRQEILSCPTARAARKLAARNRAQWRADWAKVRARVLRAGLAMQMVQSSQARALAREGYERALELAATKRVGGLPGPFVAQVLTNLFESLASKSTLRMAALVVDGYEPADLEARLDALSASAPPLSCAVYAGREASARVERWCMLRAVAVRVIGADDTRLRAEDHRELVQRANVLVVCAPSSRKAVAELLAPLQKRRNSTVRVLDFSLKAKRSLYVEPPLRSAAR